MKKLFLFPMLTVGLWADGQHVAYMCPGENVTINLTLENPKNTGDPEHGDMVDAYLQFWHKEGDWLTVEPEGDIWIGMIPNGEDKTVQISLSSDINEMGGQEAWLWYRVLIRNGDVKPQFVVFQKPWP